MKRPNITIVLTTGVAALALALTGCSGGSQPGSTGSPSSSQTGSPQPLTAQQVTVANPQSNNPTLEFPVPSVATALSTKDLSQGSGPAATPADTVTVQYVGEGAATGLQFDSSYKRGEPAEFALQEVIPGWTQGMTGMKAGGERILVIPGALAYRSGPNVPPGIEQNETLVFYVKLVSISTKPAP